MSALTPVYPVSYFSYFSLICRVIWAGSSKIFTSMPDIERRTLQRCHHGLGSRMRRAEGKRGQNRVDHVNPRQDGHQVTHTGSPAHVVTVKKNRQLVLRAIFY